VTRPGTTGKRRSGRLLVFHSTTLDGETTRFQGIPITTAERTMIDIAAAGLRGRQTGRMFREAMRLRVATMPALGRTLARHRGERGTRELAELVERYTGIPYHRTRSDAEALALELLHDARLPPPHVNMKVAGEEADLTWREAKLIIEIDGPQFHQFADEDARKQAIWEAAGFDVERIPSDDIYHQPRELLRLAVDGLS
jgi:very-short-patch-repair endonuclease